MKEKQRKSVSWLFLKVPLSTTIAIESPRRELFIDMIVERFIFQNNEITVFACFTFLKQVWDYLK